MSAGIALEQMLALAEKGELDSRLVDLVALVVDMQRVYALAGERSA